MESAEYKNKLLIVMAGYTTDIEALIRTDQGLTRRFTKKILFRALELDTTMDAFISRLKRHPNVTNVDENYYRPIVRPLFKKLIAREGWSSFDDVDRLVRGFDRELAEKNQKLLDEANGDEVLELQKRLMREYSNIVYSQDIIERAFNRVIDSRALKSEIIPRVNSHDDSHLYNTASNTNTNSREKQPEVNISINNDDDEEVDVKVLCGGGTGNDDDDSGVYDVIQQLYEQYNQKDDVEIKDVMNEALKSEEGKKKLGAILGEDPLKLSSDFINKKSRELDEKRKRLKKKREQSMLKDLDDSKTVINLLILEAEKEKDEIKRKQKEAEIERNKQKALRSMGRCEAGYEFDKVPGGYQCRGGSHFVSDNELNTICGI